VDGEEPEELRAQGASLSERSDGWRMGLGQAVRLRGQIRDGGMGDTAAVGSGRRALCSDDWLPMAAIAARFPAALDRARLVRALALRWRARPTAFCSLYPGARTGWQGSEPDRRDRRQSERQERGKGGSRIDANGYDAAKKIKGKKRHAIVDTLGLTLGVSITPANVQDRDGFLPLLKEVRRLFVFLKRLFADGGYSGDDTRAAAKRLGRVELEIIKRSDAANGFMVLSKRWIVERTFGWLGRCRRLTKDFENLTRTQLAFVQLAMIRLMARRIARVSKTS